VRGDGGVGAGAQKGDNGPDQDLEGLFHSGEGSVLATGEQMAIKSYRWFRSEGGKMMWPLRSWHRHRILRV
jgi:hypothetical protein